MCIGGGSPDLPTPPPPPKPPPPPPTLANPAVLRARERNRLGAALAFGRSSTILTGGRGLTDRPAFTTSNSLIIPGTVNTTDDIVNAPLPPRPKLNVNTIGLTEPEDTRRRRGRRGRRNQTVLGDLRRDRSTFLGAA